MRASARRVNLADYALRPISRDLHVPCAGPGSFVTGTTVGFIRRPIAFRAARGIDVERIHSDNMAQ